MPASAPTLTPTPTADSAIAMSWDRVVSDYKTFQDVRARGGTASDLPVLPDAFIKEVETTPDAKPDTDLGTTEDDLSAKTGTDTSDGHNGPDGADSGDGPADDNAKPGPTQALETTQASDSTDQVLPVPAPDTSLPPVPGIMPPQAVLGQTDDALKKLLMSWYYAGYYTGLYEGEQKALQKQQQQQPEGATESQESQSNRGDEEAQQ